jgi:hypothetical protein
MRKTALSLLAAIALTLSFAAAPANADDSASGQRFSVALTNIDSFAMPGDTLEGQLSITIPGPASGVQARKVVSIEATINTPFGDATVLTGTFRMRAGHTRTLPLSFPIDDNAAAGTYKLAIAVTVDGETLTVTQEIEIGGKR